MKPGPYSVLTRRRREVLAVIVETPPEHLTWAHIARTTGLHDWRDAKRIARDLKKIGALGEHFTPLRNPFCTCN